MKYVQLASVSTPAAVSTWFKDELVNRGVDAAYTFYVLSLLKQPEDDDDDHYNDTTHKSRYDPDNRLRAKRSAVECLKSAALEEDSTFEGFDALVDELLVRLEPSSFTNESSTTTLTLTDNVDNQPSKHSNKNSTKSPTVADPVHKEEKTLAERAKKYFDAFPALQVDSPNLNLVDQRHQINTKQSNRAKKKKNNNKNKKTAANADHLTDTKPDQQRFTDSVITSDRLSETELPSDIVISTDLRNLFDCVSGSDFQRLASCASAAELGSVIGISTIEDSDITALSNYESNSIMGSILQDESLMSNLTKKFDSRLAAIWADAPSDVAESSSSLWQISLAPFGNPHAANDDVILSISNNILTSILDDEHENHNACCSKTDRLIDDDGKHFEIQLQNSQLDVEAVAAFVKAEGPLLPTLCLKNSSLNSNVLNSAFRPVVRGTSKRTDDESSKAEPDEDNNNNNDSDDVVEDLLHSPRTHFAPIRPDLEDDFDRPFSSSLEELDSYNLPPEPPKRKSKQQPVIKQETVVEQTSPVQIEDAVASTSTATAAAVTDGQDVKVLWEMVEIEQPAIDGDVLGVAHCWMDDAVTSDVSKELVKEILDEEDRLLKDIFSEAMLTADHGALCSADDMSNASTANIAKSDSSESFEPYQDTSIDYAGLDGGAEEPLFIEQPISVEYLSHFSTGAQLTEIFESPELYDTEIVTSMRSIQNLQRQRKRLQKKPCTFYMEGNCRRTDCKFSHDLSAITCRFWEEGSCFKGVACPFLHGYEQVFDDDASQDGSVSATGKKDSKRNGKFTIGGGRSSLGVLRNARRLPVFRRLWPSGSKDSEQDFPSLSSNSSSSKTGGNAKSGAKKGTVKKTGTFVPKKAAKKKKKKASQQQSSKDNSESTTEKQQQENKK